MMHKPKTVKEAIDDLQEFFEADLYTKFRPEHIVNKKKWYREDVFTNEKEFIKYLQEHFDILRKEVEDLNNSRQTKPIEDTSKDTNRLRCSSDCSPCDNGKAKTGDTPKELLHRLVNADYNCDCELCKEDKENEK